MQKLDDKVSAEQLAVYVVWIPKWEGDVYKKARRAALIANDARVHEFVTPTLDIAEAMKPVLSWGQPVASEAGRRHASGPTPWDVHMLYGPDAVWTDTLPAPVHWGSPTVTDKELPAHLAKLVGF